MSFSGGRRNSDMATLRIGGLQNPADDTQPATSGTHMHWIELQAWEGRPGRRANAPLALSCAIARGALPALATESLSRFPSHKSRTHRRGGVMPRPRHSPSMLQSPGHPRWVRPRSVRRWAHSVTVEDAGLLPLSRFVSLIGSGGASTVAIRPMRSPTRVEIERPAKRSGLNRSMRHHLVEPFSIEDGGYERREAVETICFAES
jgi:hypothetical protein